MKKIKSPCDNCKSEDELCVLACNDFLEWIPKFIRSQIQSDSDVLHQAKRTKKRI